ncbi:MAG: multiheme c-type cytochrome [Planctomycetota bacterium]
MNAEKITYVFIGRTVLPTDKGLTTSVSDKSKLAAPWYAGLAASVFKELDNVWWFPDQTELTVLQELDCFDDLGQYFKDSKENHVWSDLSLTLNSSTLSVKEWQQHLNLPRKHNRGRDVAVIANWNTKTGSASKFLPQLTTVMMLRKLSKDADAKFNKLTASNAGHVGGFWRTEITKELVPSEHITATTNVKGIIVHHLDDASKELIAIAPADGLAGGKYIKSSCKTCHKSAVETWLSTKHARAMDTLRARMRDNDPRCVPCHTVNHTIVSTGAMVKQKHHGVQCENCHKQGQAPQNACENCHTGITDPKKHYLSQLKTICNGKADQTAGKCNR